MAKLVEGQLQLLQMVSEFSMPNRSISDLFMRDFVTTVATLQERFPDTIPRYVEVHPVMEEPRGKVLETTG
jgi:inosine-uridine nucleoside N-ribohydrolase